MPIILRNINGCRRAEIISKVDAEALVCDGKAANAPGYPDIYEEASAAEIETQGYMTRSLVALAPQKRRGRPPKVVVEDAPTDEAAE